MIDMLIWLAIALGLSIAAFAIRTLFVIRTYGPHIHRIFVESPIFSPTEGEPEPGAEAVSFQTSDGLTLAGSYLRSTSSSPHGLVVFCHEFRADRWSGSAYWEPLRDDFDIFTFDFRNHGESETVESYQSRHWLTEFEVIDLQAALSAAHKINPQLPIGLLGISRGGAAAICAARSNVHVRALVTDGAFPTHGTVVNYMRKWMMLYTNTRLISTLVSKLPSGYFGFIRDVTMRKISRELGCEFPRVERALQRIAPKPILMIHGGRDSYIRPNIAEEFYAHANEPCEFWLVKGARHNACVEIVPDEYHSRVTQFFQDHLSSESVALSGSMDSVS